MKVLKKQFLALTTQKSKDSPTCKESLSKLASRNSSKAINTDTSYDDKSNDESSDEDDQLAFISRKIRNIWKKRSGSNWNGSKKPHKKKEKTRIKASSYAMSKRNYDTSSQNVQILIYQFTRKGTPNQGTRKY